MEEKTSFIQTLNTFILKFPRAFFGLFGLLVFDGMASGISLLAVVPMTDSIIDSSLKEASDITFYFIQIFHFFNLTPSFLSFGLVFVFLNLIKAGMAVLVRYGIIKIKYKVMRDFFDEGLSVFLKARWEFFSGSNQGEIVNTLTRELTRIGDVFGYMATYLSQILQFVIYLSIPLILNFELTITALIIALVCSIPFLYISKISKNIAPKSIEAANIQAGLLNEIIQAAKVILGYGNQEETKKLFFKAFDKQWYYSNIILVLSTAVPQFFKPFGMLGAIIATSMVLKNGISISELAAVMWSLLAAMPLLSALIQGNISIRYFIPSVTQFLKLKNKALLNSERSGEIIFQKLKNEIIFKACDFMYADGTQAILNCNIKMKKGWMTAIIGESGSGKTTITDLLLGLQVPSKGSVMIDGVPLDKFDLISFRKKIGFVPQDAILFNDSVRANLLWSNSNASEEDCWSALKLSNADSFVKALSNGLDTNVGDRGQKLSGGQRQRIALARALIRNPELLILDEATSSLDTESELAINTAIDQLSKKITIIVISHRLTTVTNADYVYVLEKGYIVEEGSFNNLKLKPKGKLAKMFNLENEKTEQ